MIVIVVFVVDFVVGCCSCWYNLQCTSKYGRLRFYPNHQSYCLNHACLHQPMYKNDPWGGCSTIPTSESTQGGVQRQHLFLFHFCGMDIKFGALSSPGFKTQKSFCLYTKMIYMCMVIVPEACGLSNEAVVLDRVAHQILCSSTAP